MAGAIQHVDPHVRIARMHEDLIVFLVPGVHLIPVEGDVTLKAFPFRIGTVVRPGDILGDAGPHLKGEASLI
jgi:hypothetical protein